MTRIPFISLCTGLCACLITLGGCFGGGGGGGGGSSSTTTTETEDTDTSISTAAATITGPNTVAILVERSTTNSVNQPYVTLTLCQTGNAGNCTEIDHILVDTGSSGLRVLASALDSSVLASLDAITQDSMQLTECMLFGSGYTWGSVRSADLTIGERSASALPVQIIADPDYATVPSTCQSTGASIGSRSGMGANGILGIGNSVSDCSTYCTNATTSLYYTCVADGNCSRSAVSTTNQIPNPVTRLDSDNNGVRMVMESVADTGAASASGTLVFGIDTQDNNQMSGVTVLGTSNFGRLQSATVDGTSYSRAFLDSGSNGFFFPSSMTQCDASDWFCPDATTAFSATLTGVGTGTVATTSVTVNFSIANASTLFATGNAAFPNLGAPASNYVDLGMPFFYGRNVYVAFSGYDTLSATGPFIAF